MPSRIKQWHPAPLASMRRQQSHLARNTYPVRIPLSMFIVGPDGRPNLYDRWYIECSTAAAVRAVAKYLRAAVGSLDGLIVPDQPDTSDPSDISDPAA